MTVSAEYSACGGAGLAAWAAPASVIAAAIKKILVLFMYYSKRLPTML